jgi:hypothetical protein
MDCFDLLYELNSVATAVFRTNLVPDVFSFFLHDAVAGSSGKSFAYIVCGEGSELNSYP